MKKETEQNNIVFPIVIGFILFVIVLYVYMYMPRESKRKASCIHQLRSIGLCLKQYSMDYDDCFPPQSGAAGLELLRCNDYLSDYKMFTCPSSAVTPCSSPGGLADANISYVYRGGLTETDPADSAICWDKPNNHKNYGNILFIDGSVKGFSGVNWMDNIK